MLPSYIIFYIWLHKVLFISSCIRCCNHLTLVSALEAAPTPDVESIPEGSLNVSKGPQAPEEDKVPSETTDKQLQVVETMAQLSTNSI